MRTAIALRRLATRAVLALLLSLPQTASAEDPVHFNDANLKAAVEVALGKPNPTPTDMLGLTALYAYKRGIVDLTGLEYGVNLATLEVEENQISDISPLASLTNLTDLDAEGNQISDISPLAGLTKLTWLNLWKNEIHDISSLANLTELTVLALDGNQISNISALADLTDLQYLDLDDNQISDISSLIGLSQLTMLDLRDNPLNLQACQVHIPQILSNNPGVDLRYDPCTSQHTLTIVCGQGGSVTTEVVSNGSARTLIGVGSFVLDNGAEVEVKAAAAAGWHFARWSGTMVSEKNTLAFTLTEDERLEANFAREPQTLVVSSGAGGTVLKPGIGSFAFERGATIPVEAAANLGFRFAGWTGTVVDRKDIADASLSTTSVVLDEGGTLQANFEAIGGFHESWETAALGTYAPVKGGKFINADQGTWALGDVVSELLVCGPTPHRAQILKLGSTKALLLTSTDSESGCSDVVSVSLMETGLVNPGFGMPVDGNTVLSFYEVGQLSSPGVHRLGRDCLTPPCFDNVSLLLSDSKGNVLAYVLQRSPDATANVPNGDFKGSYREIFLSPLDIYYQRSLLSDLQTIPGFDPAGAQIRSIEFRVDEHGSAMIDDITIGPRTNSGMVPVYRFWSSAVLSQLFTISRDEKQNLLNLPSGTWEFEGIDYFALGVRSHPDAAPVYHLYSSRLSLHFYTISATEKDRLLNDSKHTWTLSGTAFYAFAEGRQPAGTCPVYRFWSGILSYYLYTTSEAERDDLISNSPDLWTFEGVAWYAYPSQWDSARVLEIVRAQP